MPSPSCFWLLAQTVWLALRRALVNAGNNITANNAMIVITIKSSIKVRAGDNVLCRFMFFDRHAPVVGTRLSYHTCTRSRELPIYDWRELARPAFSKLSRTANFTPTGGGRSFRNRKRIYSRGFIVANGEAQALSAVFEPAMLLLGIGRSFAMLQRFDYGFHRFN